MRKVALTIIIFLLLSSLLVVLYSPYTLTDIDTQSRLLNPTHEHLLGTDSLGRDLLYRTALGFLISFSIALSVSILSLLISTIIGLLSSEFELFDLIVMRLLDGIKAIPGFILALFFMAIRGAGIMNLIIILTLVSLPSFSYLIKQAASSVKQELFIEATKSMGASRSYILFHSVLPHISDVTFSQLTLTFTSTVLIESSLSYLGVGLVPPLPSLGSLLMNGKEAIFTHPIEVIIPSLLLFSLTFCIKKLEAKAKN